LLEISLKNKNFPDPEAYIIVVMRAAEEAPNNIFKNRSPYLIMHPLYILMKTSIKKYTIRELKTQKFGAPLLNIGIDKYTIVNAKTKELNVGLPYSLY
jgi:hypothetical protein